MNRRPDTEGHRTESINDLPLALAAITRAAYKRKQLGQSCSRYLQKYNRELSRAKKLQTRGEKSQAKADSASKPHLGNIRSTEASHNFARSEEMSARAAITEQLANEYKQEVHEVKNELKRLRIIAIRLGATKLQVESAIAAGTAETVGQTGDDKS